jgi:antirestriction protein ArdC
MNVYEVVTARVLKQLEAGVVPWRKTWTTGLPKSLATGREYRGVNLLLLGAADFSSAYWLTYREAQRLGGHVRKGERATPVIYWKWRTPEEMARLTAEKGIANPAPCVPFTSAVFNLDQVEGVQAPAGECSGNGEGRLSIAEQIIGRMSDAPEIAHGVAKNPAYQPGADRIVLPHLSQFENADEYYATLFHELVHATGHPRRLNRFAASEGEPIERISFEELVAELGASFLCAFAGLSNPTTDELQASYVADWAKVFRSDAQILVRAASTAQKAVDFIRGTTWDRKPAEEAA